jgi:hypothetical protein
MNFELESGARVTRALGEIALSPRAPHDSLEKSNVGIHMKGAFNGSHLT